MPGSIVDIGHDHFMKYMSWSPDRDLNPQFAGVPDTDKLGIIVFHKKSDGSECHSGAYFDCEQTRACHPNGATWKVECWEPLTISPSLLCLACGDHGFVRDGKWIPA